MNRERLSSRARVAMVALAAVLIATMGNALASPEFEPNGNPNVTLDITTSGDGDNLPSSVSLNVAGAGFQSGGFGVSGTLRQCSIELCSDSLGAFTSTSGGTFTATVTVTSSFQALDELNQPVTVDCLAVACRLRAISNDETFVSSHHITFAGSTTSSSSTSTTNTSTTSSTTSTTMVTTTSTSTTSTTSTTTSTTLPVTTTTSTTSTTLPVTTTTLSGECARLIAARATFNNQLDLARSATLRRPPSSERTALLAKIDAARASGNATYDRLIANCRG